MERVSSLYAALQHVRYRQRLWWDALLTKLRQLVASQDERHEHGHPPFLNLAWRFVCVGCRRGTIAAAAALLRSSASLLPLCSPAHLDDKVR